MTVHVYYIYELLQNTFDFFDEEQNKWSKIWFGEEGHRYFGIDLRSVLDEYLFPYIEMFNPRRGVIDDNISLLELLFDRYIDEYVYEWVKGPLCGVPDE